MPYKHCLLQISIHALREEGDTSGNGRPKRTGYFYPRPPRGGRPITFYFSADRFKISIHALREEGDLRSGQPFGHVVISIHALREEGDLRFSCSLSMPG